MKDEKRILESIRASAQELEAPEKLRPEEIGKLLERDGRRRRRKRKYYYAQAAASVAALAVCLGAILLLRPLGTEEWLQEQVLRSVTGENDPEGASAADEDGGQINTDVSVDGTQGKPGFMEEDQDTEGKPEQKQSFVRQDAGEYYAVADSYDEVAEAVRKAGITESCSSGMADGVMIRDDSAAARTDKEQQELSGQPEIMDKLSDLSAPLHSVTNVSVQGVDESDIVKTDGDYLYIVDGGLVKIVDIRDGKLETSASFTPDPDAAALEMIEMYVEGDSLMLITQNSIVTMDPQNNRSRSGNVPENDSNKALPDAPGNDSNNTTDGGGAIYLEEYKKYKMGALASTTLWTYDISDRARPVLSGSMTQDGAYKTSRKIGELVYLFTEQNVAYPSDTGDFSTGDRWIPLVNGNKIAYDSIYLPYAGSRGLIISSIDIHEPEETVDNVMILNKSVDIYMSREAFYLYRTEYSAGSETTQIARFSLEEGRINADKTASAQGRVTDSFAVSEYQEGLRVLTSETVTATGESQNHLYLFDKDLKLTGSLKGIAPGEQIYAARYIGDMAYFVTYRDTDPLFAADLSDPGNPRLMGEVKLTGFSEYLHPWEENLLLGIGYETDPETGERKGVKLVMFDISDPSQPRVDASFVISGSSQTPAADRWIAGGYKTVLAEPGKCLIGLPVEINRKDSCKEEYILYGWNGKEFTPLVRETFEEFADLSGCRGLYAGDIFYIVGPGQVTAYDMQKEYQKIKTLEL